MNDEKTVPSEGDGADTTSRRGKTPLYEAFHASRYHRQEIMRQIEQESGRQLICFVGARDSMIERSDVLGFVDLLHHVEAGRDLDLLLHTNGGDIDAAEKIMDMVVAAATAHSGQLRVVVPDHAKSAGTLMALGADEIIMSDSSELGPIDPQYILGDSNGNRLQYSVSEYLDAFHRFEDALRQDPSDQVARVMLGKLEPHAVVKMERVWDRARIAAEKFLKNGKLLPGANFTQAAMLLLDPKEWQSHGQPISADAARHKVGLNVRYLPPDAPLWQMYWRLYCLQRLAITDDQRLFESVVVSLVY